MSASGGDSARQAGLFALLATLMVLLLATLMPPFQNPDEAAHFERAEQVGRGGLIARQRATAPALIHTGIMEGYARFAGVIGHPDQRVARAIYAPVPWGSLTPIGADNTTIYPPIWYLPAAIGIRLGQHAGLSVLPTLELGRAAGGIASVAVGAAAIWLAGPAGLFLYAVLCLPMSLAQMAALSQDGPMIAASAMVAALSIRLSHGAWPHRRAGLIAQVILCGLLGMSRPPYAAFALLPLLARGFSWRARLSGVAVALAMALAWWGVAETCANVVLGHMGAVNAHAQAIGLARAPWEFTMIWARTLWLDGREYLEQIIGQLGALDMDLPERYRLLAGGMLLLAALVAWRNGAGAVAWRRLALLGGVLGLATTGIFLIQYLTWTAVGAPVIDGIQGRYFLPLILLAALGLVRPDLRCPGWGPAAARWAVLLFPVVSIVVVLHRLLLRYYL